MSEFFYIWKERLRSLREMDAKTLLRTAFLVISMLFAAGAVFSRALQWYSTLPPARSSLDPPSVFSRPAMPSNIVVQKFVFPDTRKFRYRK